MNNRVFTFTIHHSPLTIMSDNNLIPLNLVIGDRTYRVRINPIDEEVVRKTVKTINDKMMEFKTHFAGKDMQDYIAIVGDTEFQIRSARG